MFCNLHEEMNNVMEFSVSVECACSVFFHQGDVEMRMKVERLEERWRLNG